jgi:ferrous iron transport protein A
MTLKNARVGDTVKVRKVEGTGPIRRRIMDLGITKGVEIYIRKVAPLGDPFELTVRGCELSLRKEDAKMVLIEKLSSKKEEVINNVN